MKIYGLTESDPVEAPAGIVSVSGSPIVLPQGFTLPSGKTASVAGTLSVTGTSNLSVLNVSGLATLSGGLAVSSVTFTGSDALSSYSKKSFLATITGITGTTTATVWYVKIGNAVILSGSDGFSGTSISTAMTVTGLPAEILPLETKILSCIVIDSGVNYAGRMDISSGGTISFYKDVAGGAFTGSGVKGVLSLSGCYTLD